MALLRNLLVLFTCVALVFSVFSIMGCESGLQDRLTSTESELSTVRGALTTVKGELSVVEGELTTVKGELSVVEGELVWTRVALELCETAGYGILKIENNYAIASQHLTSVM